MSKCSAKMVSHFACIVLLIATANFPVVWKYQTKRFKKKIIYAGRNTDAKRIPIKTKALYDKQKQGKNSSVASEVPGLGGSPIDVKMDPDADIKPLCKAKTDKFFKIWMNVKYGLTRSPMCIFSTLKMTYDAKTRKTNNRRGIHTRIPGFIRTHTDELVTRTKFINPYFNKFVKMLLKEGYTLELSLRSALYDFRKGPGEHSQYFQDLKELIEDTYRKNKEKRIVLISHSMGGLMAVNFLKQQSKEWKQQYIRFLITLSAPWGGAIKALEAYYKGFGIHGLEFSTNVPWFSKDLPSHSPFPFIIWPALPLAPKKLLRTWPGLIWMFPSKEAWGKTEVLVRRRRKVYTLENMNEFFSDLDEPMGLEMYNDISPFTSHLPDPDVEIFCIYGTGIPTVATVHSKSTLRFPINGDGDGIVNLKSLEVCRKWVGRQIKVTAQAFSKIHHQKIMVNPLVFNYIMSLIKTDEIF